MPEATIEALLAEGRTFPPPPEFKKTALLTDAEIYDEAERDFEIGAITYIKGACLRLRVPHPIEGQEQCAQLEMMTPDVDPSRPIRAFGLVLLNQIENGLFGWCGHP